MAVMAMAVVIVAVVIVAVMRMSAARMIVIVMIMVVMVVAMGAMIVVMIVIVVGGHERLVRDSSINPGRVIQPAERRHPCDRRRTKSTHTGLPWIITRAKSTTF